MPVNTEAAESKLADIAARFSLLVWEDPAREQRIVERYNTTMNARVLRRHDGSHLTFPGLSEDIDLWPWQCDFVDRAVSTPAVFCAHEVGLGKTLTAITLAITLRQFGIANRPALIVPLHLIEESVGEQYLYDVGEVRLVRRRVAPIYVGMTNCVRYVWPRGCPEFRGTSVAAR